MVEIDAAYTQTDHKERETDTYAATKYKLTLRWLRMRGVCGEDSVLNVGCGGGTFHVMAERWGLTNVTGIEPDPEAFALARLVAPASHQILNEDLFQYAGPPVKALVIHDVLEHIENEAGAVARLCDLLQSGRGSTLVISVPAWQFLFGLHDERLGHFRRYSPPALVAALSPFFDVLYVRQLGLLGVPAAAWYSRLRHVPYPLGNGGTLDRIAAASCRLEESWVPPIGTSVLAVAAPR
jgi:SAM-dependent methyltransferase